MKLDTKLKFLETTFTIKTTVESTGRNWSKITVLVGDNYAVIKHAILNNADELPYCHLNDIHNMGEKLEFKLFKADIYNYSSEKNWINWDNNSFVYVVSSFFGKYFR